MWYFYLDESGDLGFDFVNKHPTSYFVVTILAVHGKEMNRQLLKSGALAKRRKSTKNQMIHELKGSATPFSVKKYFFEKTKGLKFSIHACILDKRKSFAKMMYEKERVYNYLAQSVLKSALNGKELSALYFFIDRSKSKQNIRAFDEAMIKQMQGVLNPKIPLNIQHVDSAQNNGIQIVDLFSWGILRKYERGDEKWYQEYKHKIESEEMVESA